MMIWGTVGAIPVGRYRVGECDLDRDRDRLEVGGA